MRRDNHTKKTCRDSLPREKKENTRSSRRCLASTFIYFDPRKPFKILFSLLICPPDGLVIILLDEIMWRQQVQVRLSLLRSIRDNNPTNCAYTCIYTAMDKFRP